MPQARTPVMSRVFPVFSVLVLAATVGIVVWAGFVSAEARAEASSRAAFTTARHELVTARDALTAASVRATAARQTAVERHASALSLSEVADPALLADPVTREAVASAGDDLAVVAGIVPAAEVVADDVQVDFGVVDMPEAFDARYTAAAEMSARARAITDGADAAHAEADRIQVAVAAVDTASDALLDSARTRGSATQPPELASPETRDAYLAAVAALGSPSTRAADYAVVVRTYQDSWRAAVASHEAETKARAARAAAAARANAGAGTPRAACTEGPAPTYIGGILVVNKSYAIPPCFGGGLTGATRAAFEAMRAEAATLGLRLVISSGYRSYATQQSLYGRFAAREGTAGADRHSARPGHSEHQSGLAFDLNSISEAFGYSAEGIWVRDNAHRFGFIVRYPPGKEGVTGYIWEPWHLRYLGVDAATAVYSSGLSLEEYLGVDSRYDG